MCYVILLIQQEKGFKIWGDQKSWKVVNWKYYPLPHVHMIFTLKGKAIYMWEDLIYPLTVGTLKQMLQIKLTVPLSIEQLVQSMRRSLLVKQELSAKYGVNIETSLR